MCPGKRSLMGTVNSPGAKPPALQSLRKSAPGIARLGGALLAASLVKNLYSNGEHKISNDGNVFVTPRIHVWFIC